MPILASCPRCSARFQLGDQFAGQPMRCGQCQATFVAPASQEPPGSVSQSQPAAGVSGATASTHLVITCSNCAGQLRLGAQFAGQQARCPHCKHVFTVPAGSKPKVAPPPLPSPASISGGNEKPQPSPPSPKREVGGAAAKPPIRPPEKRPRPPRPSVAEEELPTVPLADPDEAIAVSMADVIEPETGSPEKPRRRFPRLAKRLILFLAAGMAFLLVVLAGWLWWSFHLESFVDAPRKFRAGTMVRLRKLTSIPAPGEGEQMVYAHKHQCLFLRHPKKGVWVVDTSSGEVRESHEPQHQFIDIALSPSEDFLFVADQGAHDGAEATEPHFVHRYDLAKRTWEVKTVPSRRETTYKGERFNDRFVKKTATGTRNVPGVANPMKVVSDSRFLILPTAGYGQLTLNRWGWGKEFTEQSRASSFPNMGNFAYDPRTGYLYYAPSNPLELPIAAQLVAGNWLLAGKPYSSAKDLTELRPQIQQNGGAPVLSTNGKFLYVGKLQLEPGKLNKVLRVFPEPIRVASDDLAFGGDNHTWYHAHTGEKVGEFEYHAHLLAPSIDNAQLWVHDATGNKLHGYAIEGEQ